MTLPKRAIELAIVGGWNDYHSFGSYNGYWVVVKLKETTTVINEETGEEVAVNVSKSLRIAEILLDPAFWQALQKAFGWEWNERVAKEGNYFVSIPAWEFCARRFYDLILTNGDTEKFWEDLLSAETRN